MNFNTYKQIILEGTALNEIITCFKSVSLFFLPIHESSVTAAIFEQILQIMLNSNTQYGANQRSSQAVQISLAVHQSIRNHWRKYMKHTFQDLPTSTRLQVLFLFKNVKPLKLVVII
jgi:hypothetical protein